HLTVLAAAWAVTGDARYAAAVDRQLRSWWARNPLLAGVHWTSGIEVGMRLVAWVWIRRLLEGWAGAPALFEGNPAALDQLWWHQHYLESFPSRGSSANNHLIAEAAGQIVAALALPWLDCSPRWAEGAADRLAGALEANTFASGLRREPPQPAPGHRHPDRHQPGVRARPGRGRLAHSSTPTVGAGATGPVPGLAAVSGAGGRPPSVVADGLAASNTLAATATRRCVARTADSGSAPAQPSLASGGGEVGVCRQDASVDMS
ncbi:hypothetical protein GHK86_15235, partial [Acidimicrobiaceae bacterium USS-CC1]|nr:hypothetical protein [Acidiferrimicrobium australe]